jgi:hypothetical protein
MIVSFTSGGRTRSRSFITARTLSATATVFDSEILSTSTDTGD